MPGNVPRLRGLRGRFKKKGVHELWLAVLRTRSAQGEGGFRMRWRYRAAQLVCRGCCGVVFVIDCRMEQAGGLLVLHHAPAAS